MIDFDSRLTAVLDDIAESVRVRPDPDPVFLPTMVQTTETMHRFRPRLAAVAAAGVVLLGGSAFAMEHMIGDAPAKVAPASVPVTETTDQPLTTTSELTSTTMREVEVVATPVPVPVITPALPEPTVAPTVAPTVPPTAPTVPPVVIEFTAKLGTNGLAKSPMQQGFFGTAQPGSAIRVASQYGVSETTATSDGTWATALKMLDVPPGTKVAVRVTSSTSDKVREFSLLRPAPAPPTVIEFTADLGADGQANTPMTQGFYGKAQPGSAIRIGSDWGVAETVAGPDGKWETTLVMPEVPPGTKVHVRITSSTTDKVREFTLYRAGEIAPPFVAFTANAAQTTTDHVPPVNEYWGTSTAGAVISITSEYGSKQVESNAEGQWSARLEFPDAPLNVTFNVRITSSKGEAVFDFPLTKVGPV